MYSNKTKTNETGQYRFKKLKKVQSTYWQDTKKAAASYVYGCRWAAVEQGWSQPPLLLS